MFRFVARTSFCLALVFGLGQFATAQDAPVMNDGNVIVPTPADADPPLEDTPPSGGGTQNSPEPATLTLLAVGGVGAWWQVRRRRANQAVTAGE